MDHDSDRILASRTVSPNNDVFRASRSSKILDQEIETTPVKMRQWQRFPVDMPVQVRVTTQGPTRVVACEGQGKDLSGGGLAVTAEIDLPVGAQVGVEFIPPHSDQPITFRCFVRNRDGNQYGVEFITENDEDYRKAGELRAGLVALNSEILPPI
jgi:hypothetical protein